MTRMDRITAWTLTVFAAGTAIATGCYENASSMCHYWWVEDDQCPDEILDPPVEQSPIAALIGVPEGLDDFVTTSCLTYVRKYVWIESLQQCMWLHPDYYLTYYDYAVGGECP